MSEPEKQTPEQRLQRFTIQPGDLIPLLPPGTPLDTPIPDPPGGIDPAALAVWDEEDE